MWALDFCMCNLSCACAHALPLHMCDSRQGPHTAIPCQHNLSTLLLPVSKTTAQHHRKQTLSISCWYRSSHPLSCPTYCVCCAAGGNNLVASSQCGRWEQHASVAYLCMRNCKALQVGVCHRLDDLHAPCPSYCVCCVAHIVMPQAGTTLALL